MPWQCVQTMYVTFERC